MSWLDDWHAMGRTGKINFVATILIGVAGLVLIAIVFW
jgi:hypothetical protein